MNYKIIVKTYEDENLLYSEQTTGSILDNYLEYTTDSDNIKINLDKFSFIKTNNETKLYITENKCLLKVKEINDSLEIPLNYIKFENDNNKNITLSYKLESQENILTIKITIGDEINEI